MPEIRSPGCLISSGRYQSCSLENLFFSFFQKAIIADRRFWSLPLIPLSRIMFSRLYCHCSLYLSVWKWCYHSYHTLQFLCRENPVFKHGPYVTMVGVSYRLSRFIFVSNKMFYIFYIPEQEKMLCPW